MFSAVGSVVINRPPEEVWEYISNPSRFGEWQTASFSAARAEGDEGEGRSLVTDNRNLLGREMEHTYEITEQEHLRSLVINTVSGPIPFQLTWTLEPIDGGTRLTGEGRGDWGGDPGGAPRATRHNDVL